MSGYVCWPRRRRGCHPDQPALSWHTHRESANQTLALDMWECQRGSPLLPRYRYSPHSWATRDARRPFRRGYPVNKMCAWLGLSAFGSCVTNRSRPTGCSRAPRSSFMQVVTSQAPPSTTVQNLRRWSAAAISTRPPSLPASSRIWSGRSRPAREELSHERH
jgi:hypothetical protein